MPTSSCWPTPGWRRGAGRLADPQRIHGRELRRGHPGLPDRSGPLLQIHRFAPADAQFGDALVTSAVVVFEKVPARPAEHRPVMSFGGSLARPERVPSSALDPSSGPPESGPISRRRPPNRLPPSATTLGDLFTIRRGLVTGSNDFFILPRDEALRRGFPAVPPADPAQTPVPRRAASSRPTPKGIPCWPVPRPGRLRPARGGNPPRSSRLWRLPERAERGARTRAT